MESYHPLLGPPAAMAGVVDYKGRPITNKRGTGRWVAVFFILVIEIAERTAYNGIMFNLINYMTGHLGMSTAAAAANVTVWSGLSLMFPLLGALIADSFLSRYRTIVYSSLVYILSLGLLAFSAATPHRSHCLSEHDYNKITGYDASCPITTFKLALFYFALYLAAFAQGGHRPCVQAFGAEQFDETDMEENIWRSSFFNWWILALTITLSITPITLSYIQENINWSLGFGIPCILFSVALIVFWMGSSFYRCQTRQESSPYPQIGRAFATLVKSKLFSHAMSVAGEEKEHYPGSYRPSSAGRGDGRSKGPASIVSNLGNLLGLYSGLLPVGNFLHQTRGHLGEEDRIKLPTSAAGLQSLTHATTVVIILVYDQIFVPMMRNITGISSGITKLQRIGTGLMLSCVMMVISALVEMKRLETAREFGLVDAPTSVLPMSILWLFPQYIIMGVMTVFVAAGMQEFFFDQVPDGVRSLGISFSICIFGIGNLINSFLVYTIDKTTRGITGESWFSNNLNRAHLDYFYWLIALLNLCSFILYILFARTYVHKQKREIGCDRINVLVA
ncbi:putative peptide/nitrate transporter [Platanthera guangdongensis]|uniref:Peptide/nitrate transporter n=1 Tax=Platanthera guangdongensis TaxID=2320717 RepID=A0ABR2MQK3_9ASPA